MLINGKIGHCGYKNRIVRRSQILLFYTFTHNAVGTAMCGYKNRIVRKSIIFFYLRTMPLELQCAQCFKKSSSDLSIKCLFVINSFSSEFQPVCEH